MSKYLYYVWCIYFTDELTKLSKEGFAQYVDKEEMAKDKVLPPRNCFCAYMKMDIENLNSSLFEMVQDKDCGPELYTANYDKSIDDNLKKVAMKYALDKDDIRISPCENDAESKFYILYKYSVKIFGRNIQQKYLVEIFGRNSIQWYMLIHFNIICKYR